MVVQLSPVIPFVYLLCETKYRDSNVYFVDIQRESFGKFYKLSISVDTDVVGEYSFVEKKIVRDDKNE